MTYREKIVEIKIIKILKFAFLLKKKVIIDKMINIKEDK